MKVVFDRQPLQNAVANVIGAVQHKGTLEVLKNLHLKGTGSDVVITGTDLETTLQSRFPCPSEPFEALLPAKRLHDILRALNADIVGIETKDGKATIKAGKSRFTVSTLDPGDYPCMPEDLFGASFTIGHADLRNLISYTEHAVAKQDVRYYLNGIMFELVENQLNLVATDGHRLAKISQPINFTDEPRQIIVPGGAIQELKKLLKEGDCTVSIAMNFIKVDMGTIIFQSKLIDGKFPDYHRVIPRESQHTVKIGREQLLNATNRIGLILDKSSGMAMDFTPNRLTLSAKVHEEESEEEIECECGIESLVVGFNSQYVVDVCKAMQSDVINLYLNNATDALRIDSDERDEGVFVIMPMRL